jgi:hypothetical protein
MRGIHIRELLGPDLYEKNRPYIERALEGKTQLFDRAIPTPSGEVCHTQASYIPDVVDGHVRGFFVLVTDITERRRIEEEVERSRARRRPHDERGRAAPPGGRYLALRDRQPVGTG